MKPDPVLELLTSLRTELEGSFDLMPSNQWESSVMHLKNEIDSYISYRRAQLRGRTDE